MAFGFNVLPAAPQDASGTDWGAVLANLTGGAAPGGYAQPPAANSDTAPPPAAPPPQPAADVGAQAQQGWKPSTWDIIQGMLFNGNGAIASPNQAAQKAYAQHYALQQSQLLMQALQRAGNDDPAMQAAMLLNPTETGKALADRLATHTLNGGQTLVNGGAGGSPFTTTTYGVDNGVGYALGPNVPGGLAMSAQRLPGETKVDAESGGLYNNLGPIAGQQFSRWRTYEPQQTAGDSFAGVRGAVAPGFPSPNAPPAGPLQSSISGPIGGMQNGASTTSANAPLGIRNNNFGNLTALPNGQQWKGQVGVDPRGYAVFATPEDGINAARTNLQSYAARHGIDTVAGVISRWAPAGSNNTPNYIHYVAGSMGVDPNQKLDMSDPKVQRGLLSGIFSFENGPQEMAAWRGQMRVGQGGQGAPAAAPSASQGGDSSPSFNAVHVGSGLRTLSQQEAQAAGFPPGAVVQQDAAGKYSVAQSPEYSPEARSTIRNQVLASDEYKQAQGAMAAYKSMLANASTMTGPSAYAMLDTFARAINPGAVARPQVIETIERNLGPLNGVAGNWDRVLGQGNLTPKVRQQIIDAVVPFAQAHWDQANSLNQANLKLAQQHNLSNPDDLTAPLDERPQRMVVGDVPPASQRAPAIYQTPKGPLFWTGQGWRKIN